MRAILVTVCLFVAACEAAPNSAPAGTTEGARTITLAKFSRLDTGMSYSQAEDIIGFPGTEQSSSDIAGTRTVMYAWASPDGMANMNAMFQNDKLVTKAQFGLK